MFVINYNNINNQFMLRFPEFELFFEEQFKLWGAHDIPAHCFLGDILNEYVSGLLRENNNKQQIEKIFNFYEELACSNDLEVRNLLQVTLLEYLWDEVIVHKTALEYMLPETRTINNKVGVYLQG